VEHALRSRAGVSAHRAAVREKSDGAGAAAIAMRQQFSPTDKKAFQMFGRDEFRPIIDGLTIGLQVLLTFVGTLTLGIGGVGVMNIMLYRSTSGYARSAYGARWVLASGISNCSSGGRVPTDAAIR